jgi:hypothetical protein
MASPAAAHAPAAEANVGEKNKGSTIKNMISGGIAGAIAKTSVAPTRFLHCIIVTFYEGPSRPSSASKFYSKSARGSTCT